jgi:hypothetical protein
VDPDFLLVIGVCIGALTVPAVISAFSRSEPPRAAALCLLAGGAMVVAAEIQSPMGYKVEDLPRVFGRVIQSFL